MNINIYDLNNNKDNIIKYKVVISNGHYMTNDKETASIIIDNNDKTLSIVYNDLITHVLKLKRKILDKKDELLYHTGEAIMNTAKHGSIFKSFAKFFYETAYMPNKSAYLNTSFFGDINKSHNNSTIIMKNDFDATEEEQIMNISFMAIEAAKEELKNIFIPLIKKSYKGKEQIEKLDNLSILIDNMTTNITYESKYVAGYAMPSENRIDKDYGVDLFLPIDNGDLGHILAEEQDNLHNLIYNLMLHEGTHLVGNIFDGEMFPETTAIAVQRLSAKTLTPGLISDNITQDTKKHSYLIKEFGSTLSRLFKNIKISNDNEDNFYDIKDEDIELLEVCLEDTMNEYYNLTNKDMEATNLQIYGKREEEPLNGYIDGVIIDKTNPLNTIKADILVKKEGKDTVYSPHQQLENLNLNNILNEEEYAIMVDNTLLHSSLNIKFMENILKIKGLNSKKRKDLLNTFVLLIGQKRNFQNIYSNLSNEVVARQQKTSLNTI